MEEDKKARSARKSAFTRELNNIKKFIAEENCDEVSTRKEGFPEKFQEFETAHYKYHEHLQEEEEIDQRKVEEEEEEKAKRQREEEEAARCVFFFFFFK